MEIFYRLSIVLKLKYSLNLEIEFNLFVIILFLRFYFDLILLCLYVVRENVRIKDVIIGKYDNVVVIFVM